MDKLVAIFCILSLALAPIAARPVPMKEQALAKRSWHCQPGSDPDDDPEGPPGDKTYVQLAVTDANTGQRYGYVAYDETNGGFGATFSEDQFLWVDNPSCQPGVSTPNSPLQLINAQGAGYSYLGASAPYFANGASATAAYIGSGNANYLVLTATDASEPGPPTNIGADGYKSAGAESSIWNYSGNDADYGVQVFPQWINPDGSKPTTTMFWWPAGGFIGMTGDFSAFSDAWGYGGPAYEVVLHAENPFY